MSKPKASLLLLGLLALSTLGQPVATLSSSSRPPEPARGVSSNTASSTIRSSLDYVLVIIMENHPLNVSTCCGAANGIIGNSQAAFITRLASNYSLAGNYFAVSSGSLPDYLAMAGGSTFDTMPCISNNDPPSACALSAQNIVDRVESSGRNWKAYMEDYTGGCFGANIPSGAYDYFHNPFPYFADIQNNTTRCNRIVSANPGHSGLPDTALISDLNSTTTAPNFMWLTPNEYDNMHGYNGQTASISAGDYYLSQLVPQILGSTIFKTQNSALFITWDEPTSCTCPVPAIWVGPMVKPGYTSVASYTHYSVLSTLEAIWNLSSITSNDAVAPSMTEFLNPTASPDFSLFNSGNLAIVQGGSAYNTVSSLVLNSQSSLSLTFSCNSGLPSGATCTIDPSSYSCSTYCTSTLQIVTSSATPPGSYNVTVLGVDGIRTNSTQFTLLVLTPFKLTADLNGDCIVNIFDLAKVAGVFGSPVGPGIDPHSDVNLDGKIDVIDLVIVASHLGQTCS